MMDSAVMEAVERSILSTCLVEAVPMDSQSDFHLIDDSDFQLITFIRLKGRRSRHNSLESGWSSTFSLNRKKLSDVPG
jgi:hypothetical protein